MNKMNEEKIVPIISKPLKNTFGLLFIFFVESVVFIYYIIKVCIFLNF